MNKKPIADIAPVMAELPYWKRRKAQPLVLDGVSISKMILETREAGVCGQTPVRSGNPYRAAG